MGKKMQLDAFPHTLHLQNRKPLNKHINMKGKTIKLLDYRKNILMVLGQEKIFQDTKKTYHKEKTDKSTYTKNSTETPQRELGGNQGKTEGGVERIAHLEYIKNIYGSIRKKTYDPLEKTDQKT